VRALAAAAAAAGSTSDYIRTRIDRVQGRSTVMSARGIVASEHPLASQAGAMVLAHGGHAVDAAIAANAVMGVVAPMMNGVGGDLFAIVCDAPTGRIHGVNASGWAPSRLTIDTLTAAGLATMPQSGIHSVTVPGAVAGWDLLRSRFGRMPLSELLAPAIAVAQEGVPVTEITAAEWAGSEPVLRAEPRAAETYLVDGRAPRVGEIFRNPDLAWTYRQIAAGGRDAFYRGTIADRVIESSNERHGTLQADDLAEFEAEWVEPIATMYRGWTVYELPPNGQGVAALMMLNIIEHFPMGELGHNSADALHVLIEAKKLAYADLDRYVGDPKWTPVPAAAMLTKSYGRMRAGLVDPTRARPHVESGTLPAEGGDTTYLSVVDRDGNMVSLIQSNFANFGSAIVPRRAGFALQNRGGLFTLDANHPNALAPRKRPLHTIIPGFMQREHTQIAFGIMGGWNQAQAHAQFVSNIVDHGMNVQAALEAPRFTKLTFRGCDLIVEDRVPEPVRNELGRRGHELQVHGAFSSMVGGGQSVMRDRSTGVNCGGSDPRKDGAAVPESLGSLNYA
jgi:gamma-glutamyltranspeptidase/glutathione hydrolase